MKHRPAGMIWCICIFWVVQVRSSDFFSLGNQSITTGGGQSPIFSVHDINLASCAVTCNRDSGCMHFVYTQSDKRCDGYVKFRNCGDEGDEGTWAGSPYGPEYRQKCIKRCMVEQKQTTYKLTLKTGSKRYAASKADLTVEITGSCGQASTAIKNGKDITLRKGRKSTFKFVGDSVCGVDTLDLALTDACHNDSWFVAYVVVEDEQMATGDRDRVRFETNYWLGANKKDEKTTGIFCSTTVKYMFITFGSEISTCLSSQFCER